MKNLSNIAEILKLPMAAQGKLPPAPFSGDYPTHIYWRIRYRKTDRILNDQYDAGEPGFHTSEYVGKPNPANVGRLYKALNKWTWRWMQCEITCGEFDRKHRLYETTFQGFNDNPQAGGAHLGVGTLWSAYHPWQGLGYYLVVHTHRQYVKNVGGFKVYSTTKVLKQDYIQKYKLWMLENCGKQLKSAQERKAEREARKAAIEAAKKKPKPFPQGPYGF